MKSIINKFIFLGLMLQNALAHGQSVDSSAIYARGSSSQSRMMVTALAIPALPNISYSIPANLQLGQAVSYLPVNSGGAVYANGDVTLLAGGSTGGYVNGIGTNTRFQGQAGMVAGSSGLIYVSDAGNHTLRTYNPETREVTSFVGPTTSLSGWQDGTGSSVRFYKPVSICKDASGNLYVSDRGNNMVRKITASGVVTTLAGSTTAGYTDGTGSSARFSEPWGITVDGGGNVYVTDENNRRIRKITPTGVVTTFAGSGSASSVNGTGTAASFYGMKGIAADASGNLYVSEYNGCKVRKITPAGVVTTFAGSGSASNVDGTGTGASLYFPMAITVDGSGNVYVTQLDNRVRKITSSGVVTTVAGNGSSGSDNGSPLSATFSSLNGIFALSVDNLYLGDSGNNQVRWKGTGNGYSISPALPTGLVFDKTTGKISGTPTAVKTMTNYTITAYNAAGSSTKVVSFAVLAANGLSLSKEQNYIVTRIPRKAYSDVGSLEGKIVDSLNVSIQYFDGLGRVLQNRQWQGSPLKNDIVQYFEYDGYGRESIKYLQHVKNTVNNGSFSTTAKDDQRAYYASSNTWDAAVVKTPNPYAITVFENSPLNRILEQGAPGSAWQPLPAVGTGHTVKTGYGTNTATGLDVVKLWTVTTSGASGTANYGGGKLYRTTTWDENTVNTTDRSGSVDEYKDFDGRVVLKRVWESESKALNTYYVYDDLGDLRYVIPPAVTGTGFSELSTDPTYVNFDNYVYAYKYDGRRRVIKKKIPGKGWEYLVYNKNDQVVFTRDAEQLKREEWSFTKYDAFGRVVMTGVERGHVGDNHDYLQQALADFTGPMWEERGSVMEGYTNNTIPQNTDNLTILQVNYYDDYAFGGATTLPVSGVTKSTKIKSLQTGTKVYRTDGTQPLLTVLYYDDYGRVIQSASKNHLGGTDYVTNTYNFPGELLTSTRVHTPATGAATTIVTTNEYDHVGRLVSTKEKIGSQAEVILASNSYNEIGQLKSKAVGKSGTETSFVNTTTYSYNERGWLNKSTSPKFSQQLKYQDGTNPQWNGNISQQLWGDDATLPNTFSYQYDKLNRLTSGSNGQTGAASITEVITYDDLGMGNIKTLKRDALTATTYTYTGNKLMSLSGGLTGSYTYDANGNAKTDRMGMAITYNYLNLPQTAKKTGVDVAFLYDATGTKLQKLSKIGTAPNVITTTRDYVGGIEYNNGAIDIIHNSEGYALKSGTNYIYHYNLTDHLGNVRATLKRGSSSTAVDVVQRDNYYPFGKRKVVAGGNNNYLYNGKEIQGELGDQYDYGARFYDAEIGRWNVVDPAAEYYPEVSPYSYVLNDPLGYNDENGEMPGPVGAIIGIAADYVQQVGLNYFVDGKDFRTSLTDISYWSLAVSGASGFASGGISSLTNTLTSKVGQKALTKIIDVGVDVMVSTIESAVTNKLEGGDLDVWKSFTGGLIEAGIAKYIPLKYVDKLEKKLFKKMNISASKAEKYRRRMLNDSHRNKNTQRRNRTKFAEYSKQSSDYTRAYIGVKTVNDAYKGGGAEALQQLDLYFNIPPSPRRIIEVGTPQITGFER